MRLQTFFFFANWPLGFSMSHFLSSLNHQHGGYVVFLWGSHVRASRLHIFLFAYIKIFIIIFMINIFLYQHGLPRGCIVYGFNVKNIYIEDDIFSKYYWIIDCAHIILRQYFKAFLLLSYLKFYYLKNWKVYE